MQQNKINHLKITPLWPQGNAEAENFMKSLKKCIQTAYIEKKDWKTELYQFMLNYRATPQLTTRVAPATALFGRTIRTKLPSIPSTVGDMKGRNSGIDKADREAKEKRNSYANKRRVTKEPHFKVGDQVLVRQTKVNKLTPRFNPQTYQVTEIKGTMITASRADHMITRNCSHFKKFLGKSNLIADMHSDNETDEEEREHVPDGNNPREIGDQHLIGGHRNCLQRQRFRPSYYHEKHYNSSYSYQVYIKNRLCFVKIMDRNFRMNLGRDVVFIFMLLHVCTI
jgi:hypothetical protein